ncbi:hypothetical protein A3D80_00390 [Candidatus Roizmanbacteria bacterium RIFCSPHIGHO2_02_FULL_40_13b]|uniref:DNA polymerase III delta N-terminal domain-containing protein n=1 Tax=Candidatus Roizmanbacteria bacterium RIFCSPHIGHO2_01_FULL_39_24 TaxID=1802032 RepID=A0A1F7GIS7_9BACT|nr:MAG: hypothetical protein A2799_03975 [Candidatus Roizmanbacteria bacterium RIFCSPHIGHO2_01_FULL_39_24]OGK26550.1 MAG: hypothetical protein A3D80_00390 [Candidatus Roizmanbacteria bacterium RIFCSPHIGHO2_02_FULL_40_13b]OGK49400.1 MAG: hypothetical protein A3A56_01885 [Candidatus Roizmanbacteria bacterium RIFCSPLOWO2_01_FULL_40_32]OGK56594.1 MAG: hypothetical protein A3H83_03420 [Candidatus Roizmanbacteria bacterium RIFCSPLOWO2_02_FULL_39_8]
MLPILITTNVEKTAQKYIDDLGKKRGVFPSYIFTIRKDGIELKIEQMRELMTDISRLSSTKTMIVIYDFETASTQVQNILLKTLEESPSKFQFILVSMGEETVLPTVLSRVKVIKLGKKKVELENFNFGASIADLFASMGDFQKKPEKAVLLCDKLLVFFKKKMETSSRKNEQIGQIVEIINELLKVRMLLQRNNISPQLAIDHLMIFIKLKIEILT